MSGTILMLLAGIVLIVFGLSATSNTIILIAGVFLTLITFYTIYKQLILAKNKVKEAYSSVDVQLKKRYDLIPNILTIANKFMEHEKGLLEEITKLRTQAMHLPSDISAIEKKASLDSLIQGKMGQLKVALENYPQLKSDQTMIMAMQTYNEVEEHICAARRFYNSAVNELNNHVEIFPSSIFASMLNIKTEKYFEAQEQERQAISASQYLK